MSLSCDCLPSFAAALNCFAGVHSLSPANYHLPTLCSNSLFLCAQLLQQQYKKATDDGTCLKSLVVVLSSQRNSAKVCLDPGGHHINRLSHV